MLLKGRKIIGEGRQFLFVDVRKPRRKRRKIPGVGKYLLGGEKWRKDEKKEK